MGDSQLADLLNMGTLLEEAREVARALAHHRKASVEAQLGSALDEVDRQVADLRSNRTK
jgi:NTP pyrophosphatase (non-canonical NTP hydrolase)